MQTSLFQPESTFSSDWYIFKKTTELGKIYDSLPWEALVTCLPQKPLGRRGAPSWFSPQGMLALMFIKAYSGLSDEKLIDRMNTDWSFQLFCGLRLSRGERIRDKSIVSRIRKYLSEHLDQVRMQEVLLSFWKQDMSATHVLLMDATCYESYVRFPTDVKLLWESTSYLYERLLFKSCQALSIKRPRSKYREQKQKQLSYSRLRRKSYKLGQKRKRSLLYLLEKGLGHLQAVLHEHPEYKLERKEYRYLKTIKQVFRQQHYLFTTPGAKLPDRIISLHKPYLRPIVRGKENKPVEFGMKAHMLQVDGITFFDCMSFKAFNECKRLKISVLKHQSLFKTTCHQLGADRIYATNENRRYLSGKQIFTNFPKKGPKSHSKQEKKLQQALATVRSTTLEGAFGNQKNHYGLRKIKAVGDANERLWAFFAVMTENAVKMAKRKTHPPNIIAA